MSAVTSRADAAIVNLAALLTARDGLTGVNVFEEPQKPEILGTEYIIVATKVSDQQDWAGFGARSRDETFQIEGVIETVFPGAGDEVSTLVRQRTLAILAEIEAELRDGTIGVTLNEAVNYAQIVSFEYEPAANDQVRSGRIRFTIGCFARLNG